jgi:hypothetical protein
LAEDLPADKISKDFSGKDVEDEDRFKKRGGDLLIKNILGYAEQCVIYNDEGGYDVRNEETKAGHAVQAVHRSDCL